MLVWKLKPYGANTLDDPFTVLRGFLCTIEIFIIPTWQLDMNDICTLWKNKACSKKENKASLRGSVFGTPGLTHSDEILHLSGAHQRNRMIMQLISSQVRQKREVGNAAASVNMHTLKIWEA